MPSSRAIPRPRSIPILSLKVIVPARLCPWAPDLFLLSSRPARAPTPLESGADRGRALTAAARCRARCLRRGLDRANLRDRNGALVVEQLPDAGLLLCWQ